MTKVLPKRGDALLRRRTAGQNSGNAVDRIAFAQFTRRQRAWVDLLLGSMIPGEEKDALLRETFAEVLSGRSELSSHLYHTEEAFETDLRLLLRGKCEVLMGGFGD